VLLARALLFVRDQQGATMHKPFAPLVRSQAYLAALFTCLTSSLAHAQSMGGGLVSYATPIVGFLAAGAVVVALAAALFKPELVTKAAWAAVVAVVIFFILRNMSALQSAVTTG
jgi:hypothetical protein